MLTAAKRHLTQLSISEESKLLEPSTATPLTATELDSPTLDEAHTERKALMAPLLFTGAGLSESPVEAHIPSRLPEAKPVIRFFDAERTYLDFLEAVNEDPFTLESFESLMDQYRAANKEFIVARVTTFDENSGCHFYSYYAAHHLNKVLFRTQPELGLLHRMKVNNPLNNMLIHGDVHYFVVNKSYTEVVERVETEDLIATTNNSFGAKVRKVSRDLQGRLFNFTSDANEASVKHNTKTTISRRRSSNGSVSKDGSGKEFNLNRRLSALSTTSSHSNFPIERRRTLCIVLPPVGDVLDHAPLTPVTVTKPASHTMTKALPNTRHIPDIPLMEVLQETCEGSPTVQSPNEGCVLARRRVFEASFFNTDDGFLMESSVRHFFRSNALEADDATLFSIPVEANVEPQFREDVEPHPTLPGFGFVFGDEESGVAGAEHRRRFTIKAFVTFYIGLSIIAVRFLASEEAALQWAGRLLGLLWVILALLL